MLRRGVLNKISFVRVMSKKSLKKSKLGAPAESSTQESQQLENNPIKLSKEGNIVVQIYAKPGAKQNAITGITTEGVNVQINAPPSEGAANTELVKYIARVLGLRPGNILLDKGHKSRQKVLKVDSNLSLEEVKQKINQEVNNN